MTATANTSPNPSIYSNDSTCPSIQEGAIIDWETGLPLATGTRPDFELAKTEYWPPLGHNPYGEQPTMTLDQSPNAAYLQSQPKPVAPTVSPEADCPDLYTMIHSSGYFNRLMNSINEENLQSMLKLSLADDNTSNPAPTFTDSPKWQPNTVFPPHYPTHSVSLDETFFQPSSQETEISVASNSSSNSSSQSMWISCSPANSPPPTDQQPKRRRRIKKANTNAQFPCSKCTCTFARARDLTRHFRLHTGERPYECLGCGERFIRVDARKRHWAARPTCSEVHQNLS
ncbi:hypothetical protein CPB86DRAFT_553443 [Serendipita vermifera]|nr:hypothetical protein CPB86DRAFT_553443 [Serendipita vermifera]